jgi:hypothetical protein
MRLYTAIAEFDILATSVEQLPVGYQDPKAFEEEPWYFNQFDDEEAVLNGLSLGASVVTELTRAVRRREE